jgi:hypothetical protein
MYISNMTHFLDGSGNIPKQMPKEGREMASFLALNIDTTTKNNPKTLTSTEIRCFEEGCQGMISSEILGKNDDIHWKCSKCQNEGQISGWKKTKWDNQRSSKP